MWAVAGWIESQMAEIPSIFARGHSRSLCLFVCGGPLWHKGFSQTCACIPSPPLSTPAVPARAPLASCPDERQLTRFVCTLWHMTCSGTIVPAPNATHASIVPLPRGPLKNLLVPKCRHSASQDRHNGRNGVIVMASGGGFVRGPSRYGGAAVGAVSGLRYI